MSTIVRGCYGTFLVDSDMTAVMAGEYMYITKIRAETLFNNHSVKFDVFIN